MKITVNDRCEGHGLCVDLAPDVFELRDEDDMVTVLNRSPDDGRRLALEEAVRSCPMQAVELED